VTLKATEQPMDTSGAAGKVLVDMLGGFAKVATSLRRERQTEEIAAAQERDVHKDRKPKIEPDEVRCLQRQEELGPSAMAQRIEVARSSVDRVLSDGAQGIE
jgi:DNA invertase Pin-like site-specific DNA recombinase